MAQHEIDFGFTNESKNIDSYGDIAFLKRSQIRRTPCRVKEEILQRTLFIKNVQMFP